MKGLPRHGKQNTWGLCCMAHSLMATTSTPSARIALRITMRPIRPRYRWSREINRLRKMPYRNCDRERIFWILRYDDIDNDYTYPLIPTLTWKQTMVSECTTDNVQSKRPTMLWWVLRVFDGGERRELFMRVTSVLYGSTRVCRSLSGFKNSRQSDALANLPHNNLLSGYDWSKLRL